jgi:hypothetical protein
VTRNAMRAQPGRLLTATRARRPGETGSRGEYVHIDRGRVVRGRLTAGLESSYATARCLSTYKVYWTHRPIQPSRDIGANAGHARGPDIAGHSGAPQKGELAVFAPAREPCPRLGLARRVWRPVSSSAP